MITITAKLEIAPTIVAIAALLQMDWIAPSCQRGWTSHSAAALVAAFTAAVVAVIGQQQALDCAIANNNLYASTWPKIFCIVYVKLILLYIMRSK